MNLHVMIAEDEIMAQKELIYLLQRESDITLCPSAQTGEQLTTLYEEHEPDVIFLDVEMPGMSGVTAANKITALSEGDLPLFIFTTAYEEYALEAFDINAVDYLLKPYDESRFQTSLARVRKKFHQMEEQWSKKATPSNNKTDKLLVEDGERMVVLDPDTILYAVPYNRMLEIHTIGNEVVTSRLSLQELEEKLGGQLFFRTHRSYLVNLNYVKEITPWFNGTSNVTLNDDIQTTIPVSRAARKMLLKHFNW